MFFIPNFVFLLWLYDEWMYGWNTAVQFVEVNFTWAKQMKRIRILWWEFKASTICSRKKFKSILESDKQFESDSLAEIGLTKMAPDRSERGENPLRVSE